MQHPCHPLGKPAISRVFVGHAAVPSLWWHCWLFGLGLEVWPATAGSAVNADLDLQGRVTGRKLCSCSGRGLQLTCLSFPLTVLGPTERVLLHPGEFSNLRKLEKAVLSRAVKKSSEQSACLRHSRSLLLRSHFQPALALLLQM